MTQEELQSLKHGLYKIYWESGGKSFASIGSYSDGSRWIAICNWINGSVPLSDFTDDSFGAIRSVKKLEI